MQNLKIPRDWVAALGDDFCSTFLTEISQHLKEFHDQKILIYPPLDVVFRAFELSSFKKTRVLILGQDPYHGTSQANGLSFSVNSYLKIPPSLKNIFKELNSDLGISQSSHGNLESWANQGVLLLNSALTVEHGIPNSHALLGWSKLTDRVIKVLSNRGDAVFILWGKLAQTKLQLVDLEKNCILTAPHPSPLSAYRGFFGCHHFSKANQGLIDMGKPVVNWELEPLKFS